MRLREFEGKRLLEEHGISIPKGIIYRTSADLARITDFPLVVKSQVLEGGRGKRGGIKFAEETSELRSVLDQVAAGGNGLPRSEEVLVEERLEIEREFYIALVVDRDRQCPVLLASAEGGVEIESVADTLILRVPVNPYVGIPDFAVRQVAQNFELNVPQRTNLGIVLHGLWNLFRSEDCMLAEINPLVLTTGGQLVAADARLILDENARWRHSTWPGAREGTPFERRCAELGATGTEMEGDVAVVTSGAGLGMATVDMVASFGGSLRCFVDLGGSVFQGSEKLASVVDAVRELRPRTILFNYFFSFARADILASGIASSFSRQAPECPVTIRMRGVRSSEAADLLHPFGFVTTGDLVDACRAAVVAASRDSYIGEA